MTIPDVQPLTFRLAGGVGSTLIDPASTLHRNPIFWTKVSAVESVLPPLSVIEAHSKVRTLLGPTRIFGSHHLHAFIEHDGSFSTQSADPKAALAAHIRLNQGKIGVMPQIFLNNELPFVDYSLASETVQVNTAALFVSPTEPMNWGMWLLTTLPALYDFSSFPRSMKIMSFVQSQWQEKFLAFCGALPERIVRQHPWQTYDVPECVFHQYSKIDLCIRPSDTVAFDWARSLAKKELGTNFSRRGAKIFISRRSISEAKNGFRRLQNEGELIERLVADGYEIVEPEKMSLPEQIAVFSHAERVIGLGGAGMFNCVFCKPGTSVVSIEATDHFSVAHANLFTSSELPCGFIFGDPIQGDLRGPHSEWRLNIKAAMNLISAMP